MPYYQTTKPIFAHLPKLKPGQTVSVISPSAGLPGLFPHVLDLGLQRLAEHFGLSAIEYPTTRQFGSSLKDRARDIMAAFEDDRTSAVIATTGGTDQIRLLEFLDPERIKASQKAFFGYSDNTHLCNLLWCHGIPTYYGATLMQQFGQSHAMDDLTREYIHHAMFDDGFFEIKPDSYFIEEELSWDNPENLLLPRNRHENEAWRWDDPHSEEGRSQEGILWGGCVESLFYELGVNRWLPSPEALSGAILCLETCELISPASYVEEFLVSLGERGILEAVSGLLIARPKSWFILGKQPSLEERAAYRTEQWETVVKVFRQYNSSAPVVFGLDFGHTDPQIPIPLGKRGRIDCGKRRVEMEF